MSARFRQLVRQNATELRQYPDPQNRDYFTIIQFVDSLLTEIMMPRNVKLLLAAAMAVVGRGSTV